MQGALTFETIGNQTRVTNRVSAYQPSQEITELYKRIKEDYESGWEILNRPYDEFNGLSFIDRANEDQKNWLSWIPDQSGDPEEAWRWFGTRPITRNKIVSTAAHLTSRLLKPSVFAQNDKDDEDKEAAEIIDTLLDYNIRRSHYETAFLYGVVSGLVNPLSYFEVNYCNSYQEILEGTYKSYERKKVLDEENSGFQYGILPFDEILFANPYQFFLQKQRFNMKKKRVSYHELEGKYSWHPNWEHVQPGISVVLGEDNVFYDVEDINDELCEVVEPMYRTSDSQTCWINGIYFGDENVDYNPFYHRTHKNKPRYPFVKYGAEPIDAMRFYGYKSLAAKLANDQALVDRMWQLSMDGKYLDTLEPIATIGAGKFDKSVQVPATVTDFPKGAEIQRLRFGNSNAAVEALHEAERSMTESSLDSQLQGQSSSPDKTARGALLEQQNAETNLGFIGKMIGVMAKEAGELMVDDILRYQTVGEVEEIIGGLPKMKYKTFLVDGKVKEGKNKTAIVRFTDKYSYEMSDEDKRTHNLELYEEAGDGKVIYEADPVIFQKLDFLITFDSEQMMKRNTAFEQAIKLEIYDRAIQNPYVNQELITRDFLLEPLIKGDAAKYVKDAEEVAEALAPNPQNGQPKGVASDIMKNTATREILPV